MTVICRVLDKISLLKVYDSIDNIEFNESITQANIFASGGDLKKQTKKHSTIFIKPYKGKFDRTVLSFTFFAVKGKPALAIKFCPRKLTEDEWADVISWFQVLIGVGEVWDSFRLSTAEICVDLLIPYTDLVFFDPDKKISDDFYHQQGLLYIGSKKGRRSSRIYDKRKQLVEKKGLQLAYPLTRIEVIQAGLKLRVSEFAKLKQPFGKLIALRKDVLEVLKNKYASDVEFCEFCAQVLAGAAGNCAFWKKDASVRKRIVKILRPHRIGLHASNEQWGFWKSIQTSLLRRLKDC